MVHFRKSGHILQSAKILSVKCPKSTIHENFLLHNKPAPYGNLCSTITVKAGDFSHFPSFFAFNTINIRSHTSATAYATNKIYKYRFELKKTLTFTRVCLLSFPPLSKANLAFWVHHKSSTRALYMATCTSACKAGDTFSLVCVSCCRITSLFALCKLGNKHRTCMVTQCIYKVVREMHIFIYIPF